MKPQGHIPPSAPPSAHEGADLNVPRILRVFLVLAATLAALLFLVNSLFSHFDQKYPARTSEAAPVVTPADLPPAPRLQMHPERDLQAVRAGEDLHLNGYAWVNRSQGIAQIPIDRAMVIWAKTYVPFTPATNVAPAPDELQMRQQKATESTHAP